MDYKQKYKQALERAKEMCALPTDKATMEYIFPELKENYGEKIREEIIAFLRSKNGYMTPNEDWDFHNRWLAWLEKQGEKNINQLGRSYATINTTEKFSEEGYNEDYNAGCDKGYEQAIEKACEWIHTAIYLDYENGIEHRYATLEELLNDFKKAMKGGEA